MQPEEFQKQFNVSRESMERLEIYHALLVKWQRAINLVGPKTIPDAWARHFADSAQVLPHIPAGVKTLADLGSGAGFPGLVIAIMRPDISVHLIESDERKVQFLKNVSRESSVDVTVHNERIESVAAQLSPDCMTARALADLSTLCGFARGWAENRADFTMILPKGQAAEQEIEAARAQYDFMVDIFPSQTDGEARILKISGLVARG